VIGNRTKVKIVKNKIAAPFREAEVDILYGKGISREGDVLDLGVQHGLIEKSGSWYSYKGERIGQGRDTARQALIDRPEFCDTVEAELRRTLGLGQNAQKMPPEFELLGSSEPRRATAAS
jgi:recombination protein RecA